MTQFQIVSNASGRFNSYRDTQITIPADDSALTVRTERGLANPATGLTQLGIGVPATLGHVSRTRNVEPSGGLADAVSALHELGDRYGVTGLSMIDGQPESALLQFDGGDGAFVGGEPADARVPSEMQAQLASAAADVVRGLRSSPDA